MHRHKGLLWVLACLPLILDLQVAGVADPIVNLDNVAGKLVFYQRQGNATLVRDTGELASDVPTEAMFQLSDPQKTLRSAKFTYTWDFGNGAVIEGTEPVVQYNYAESGNYTLRLKVGAEMEDEEEEGIEGVYSMNLKVLDTIKSIDLEGPTSFHVSQNSSLDFHVDGSPPMWVCWRILPNCESDTPVGCTLTMLYTNTLQVNYTFTSTGLHCLDISARNDVSKLQTSYSIYVSRNPLSHLFFILPCVAVFLAMFSFITVITCRPRIHKQMVASSNAVFVKNPGGGPSRVSVSYSSTNGENQPLVNDQPTRYYY